MIYTLNITIPDEDIADVTTVLSERYGYSDTIQVDETIVIPAVLNQDWEVVEAERTITTKNDAPNPVSLLEHMWDRISSDIKWYVVDKKRRALIEEATSAIDNTTITPGMDVTITS